MAKPATTTNPAPGGAAATDAFNFKAVLQQLVQRNASDLHLKVGRPPTLRLHGELVPLEMPPLRPEDLKGLAEQLMTPRQVKEFTDNKECDFAIGVPGIGRFRCNVYQQRGSLCYAMRSIPYQARTLQELNLPPRSEEHTSELQSHVNLVCRLLLEKKNDRCSVAWTPSQHRSR